MDNKTNDTSKPEDSQAPAKPNESSGVYVRGFVKITDPETGRVIVQTAN